MKHGYRALVAAALLSASGAWAVAKGGSLFIKAQGQKLLKEPKLGAAAVVPKPLDVATEVKWLGPSAADKQFHEIEVNGKKGFVLMSSLSPSKPAAEIDASTGKAMDTKAFASSGAATKGLTEASLKYSKEKGTTVEAAAVQVIYAEEHNKNKGTPDAIAAKAKELGGAK